MRIEVKASRQHTINRIITYKDGGCRVQIGPLPQAAAINSRSARNQSVIYRRARRTRVQIGEKSELKIQELRGAPDGQNS